MSQSDRQTGVRLIVGISGMEKGEIELTPNKLYVENASLTVVKMTVGSFRK